MKTDSLAKLDSLLDDQPQEGVTYVKPSSIETKLSTEKRDEVHQIVQEVLRFGINQRQLLYLIQQLSLNLENRQVMIALTTAINENREKIPAPAVIAKLPKKKIIVS